MRIKRFLAIWILVFIGVLQAQNSSLDLALRLMGETQYIQAAQILEQRLKSSPKDVHALKLLGQIQMALQEYGKAAQAFSLVLQENPADSSSAFYLAKCFIQTGDYEKARPILKKLLKEHPGQVAAKIQLAKLQFESESYSSALRLYGALLRQFPQNPSFYKQAGLCASKLNQNKQAEAYLRKAFQLNSKDLKVAVLLYNLFKKEERWPEALNILNLALVSHSHSAKLYLARGEVYLSMKKFLKARQDYSKALTLGDSSAYLYKKLGVAYYYLNDFAAALYALQKSARANPKDPLVFYFLGLAQKKLSMPDKAISSFNKALTLIFPSYLPDIYFNLADSYAAQKKYPTALKYYKEVLNVDPKRTIVLFYMATLYDKYYKDLQVPLRYYQQFLEQAGEQIPQRYKTYAVERMKAIKGKLHFQKGKKEK